MNDDEIHLARSMFRARIDSLRNDVLCCFWPISNATSPSSVGSGRLPQAALFPAVMYCFATADYFSSFWAGWNDSKGRRGLPDSNQTRRITGFLNKYLRYPIRESFIAVTVWRHKLMHTAQPRVVAASAAGKPDRAYLWAAGIAGSWRDEEIISHHMRLSRLPQKDGVDRSRIYFDCNEFVRDLEDGVFGPNGYFVDLVGTGTYSHLSPLSPPPSPPPPSPVMTLPVLQQHFRDCRDELEKHMINFAEVGLLPE